MLNLVKTAPFVFGWVASMGFRILPQQDKAKALGSLRDDAQALRNDAALLAGDVALAFTVFEAEMKVEKHVR